MTDIQITPKWSEVKPSNFYVYIHRRATDGSIFYVGKGKDDRAWERHGRGIRWNRTARKHGVNVFIYKDGMNEMCALTLEKILISMLDFDQLSNSTKGGDGTTGMRHTDKTIAYMAKKIYCSNGMEFISSGKAEEWVKENINPKASRSVILSCCPGNIGGCYGLTWSYTYPAPEFISRSERISSKSRRRMVACSNGLLFPSINDAKKWLHHQGVLNAHGASITTCAKGNQKTAYGYSWKYVVDTTGVDVLEAAQATIGGNT